MKISKLLKRSLIVVLSLFVLIIAAAIAVPYFFKDEIVAWVKQDINNNVNATVDFADVDLSLLRSFPDFNFQISQLSVVGKDDFEGIPLLAADNMELDLDLKSVLQSDQPIEVNKVILDQPVMNIRVLKDGRTNYDLAKADSAPAETTTSEEPMHFLVQLKDYAINNGTLSYHDKSADFFLDMEGLNHSGSGDFTQTVFDLDTETSVDKMTAVTGGIAYLYKVQATLDAIINADIEQMKFTLKDNDLKINALQLLAEGYIQLDGDDYNMDINYKAPGNSFKNFLSLIPNAYTKDFASVKANGNMEFYGFVKGTYNAIKEQYPAFKIFLDVQNGDFQYPDLPMAVTGILAKVNIDSPGSDFDKMKVQIPQFKMNLGNNPFSARFNLATPISDPSVDTEIDGIIDLADLAKAFPMEGVQEMNGRITANLKADTRLSYVEKQRYEDVNMSGKMRLEDFNYNASDMPAVKIADLNMDFTPRNVVLNNFEAQLGASDVKARGTIDNILAYFSPEKTMTGKLEMRSSFFDVNEWMPAETSSSPPPTPVNNGAATAEGTEIFDRFDFTVDGKIDHLKYDIYDLKRLSANGRFTPNDFNIRDFSTLIGDSDLSGNGQLTNVFNYVFDNEVLGGKLNLKSSFLNLNQFMEEAPAETPQAKTIANEEEYAIIPVPENMDIDINADLGKVLYTNIELEDVKGLLAIDNEVMAIKNGSAKTMGGSFDMEGSYNTQDIDKPTFDLDYTLQRMDFEKAFSQFNTFEALAPVGKFIKGNFNTKMSFNGVLGKDMMPELGTLSAEGFLETIDGFINNFKPLEALGQKLNIDYLKSIKIKDSRNWFSVENGSVIIKEFDAKVKDINMKIAGKHGINMLDMDYNIFAKVPRELLEKNAVGALANTGMDFITKEAAKYGVNIQNGAFINLNVNLTGSIKDPKIQIKVVGADGESSVKDVAMEKFNEVKQQAIDSVTNVANQKIDEGKAKANEKIDQATDTVKAIVDKEVDKAKEKAKEEIGKVVKDEAGKVVGDSLLNKGEEKLDKILGGKTDEAKDKAKDAINNLFGKKKKKKKDEGN
ncbi:MAG: AsmA-like C-terminal region-containing protein [Bacteroidota bacterium]